MYTEDILGIDTEAYKVMKLNTNLLTIIKILINPIVCVKLKEQIKKDYCSIGFPLYVNDFNVSWSSLTTSSGNGTYPKSDAKVCPSVIA